MTHITQTLLGLSLIANLGACAGKSSIKADSIRALPEVSMDQALSAFEQVCIHNGKDPTNGAVLFKRGTLINGISLCTMRARPPADVDALQDLKNRFGTAQQIPDSIITQFPDYPNRPLIYMSGAKGGADEGTFQIGVES